MFFFQEDGKFTFNISAHEYQRQVQYRYDPFCVSSSIRLVVEVTEAGRKLNQSASTVVPLVANPVSVSFQDNNPTVFRPGLPYTIKVSIHFLRKGGLPPYPTFFSVHQQQCLLLQAHMHNLLVCCPPLFESLLPFWKNPTFCRFHQN